MFFFIALGVCLVGVAVALQLGWIILNWRRLAPLVIGIPFFALLIVGLILNTVFLVREVRRNEQQDSFLNAVTHELKTPITSIRLYLDTMRRRDVSREQQQQFLAVMSEDTDRLMATVEQVLKAGELGQRARSQIRVRVDMDELVRGGGGHRNRPLSSGRGRNPLRATSAACRNGLRSSRQPGRSPHRRAERHRQRSEIFAERSASHHRALCRKRCLGDGERRGPGSRHSAAAT